MTKVDKKNDAMPLTETEKRSYGLLLAHRAQHEKQIMKLSNDMNANSLQVLRDRGLDPAEYEVDLNTAHIIKKVKAPPTPAEVAAAGKKGKADAKEAGKGGKKNSKGVSGKKASKG